MNKPENNSFNKARFFALYFGQRVLIQDGKGPYDVLRLTPHDLLVPPEDYLELRSVDMLTDEDAINVALCDGCSPSKENLVYYGRSILSGRIGPIKSYVADHLRSIGVAIPYMGLSVEDLIEYGWAKIKEAKP